MPSPKPPALQLHKCTITEEENNVAKLRNAQGRLMGQHGSSTVVHLK
jgi:hypothetical protein